MLPKISFSRGKGVLKHNNRVFVSPNVDKDRIKDNLVFAMQPLEEAYDEIFGEAQRAYNDKQKRGDRKIDNYFLKLFGNENYDVVQKNSNEQQSFYEYVVGIGDRETHGFKNNPEAAQTAIECLREYINGFQERNPNFYVFNAVIHCDEATPHLHFDFVPFSDGYKTGMTRQQGIGKALENMGYGTGKKSIANFTKSERSVFRKICEAHGIEVAEEEKGRGKTYTPEEYKKMKKDVLSEMQNKALAYEQPPKGTLETQRAYEQRVATEKQAIAVSQRSAELDEKEAHLAEWEKALRHTADEYKKGLNDVQEQKRKLAALYNKEVYHIKGQAKIMSQKSLEHSERYARNMAVCDAYKKRYEKVFGKPYNDTAERSNDYGNHNAYAEKNLGDTGGTGAGRKTPHGRD